MGDIFNNILTLGAHGRVKNANENLRQTIRNLEEVHGKMERKKEDLNLTLIELLKLKKKTIKSLEKLRRITQSFIFKDRDNLSFQINSSKLDITTFQYIEKSVDLGLIAINATKSIGTGLSTAAGVHFLVGKLGTASTGIAISKLSGAAATNATLAWLGGGSASVGGGGMAAGSIVSGGLVIIPTMVVMGLLNHLKANKEIKEIKSKELEAYQAISNLKSNILGMDLISIRSDELIYSLKKAKSVYELEFEKIYKELFPVPIISKLIKHYKKRNNKEIFKDYEIEKISHLGKVAEQVLKIVDTKVLD